MLEKNTFNKNKKENAKVLLVALGNNFSRRVSSKLEKSLYENKEDILSKVGTDKVPMEYESERIQDANDNLANLIIENRRLLEKNTSFNDDVGMSTVNALRFISYYMTGYSHADAWKLTFPHRLKALVEKCNRDTAKIKKRITSNGVAFFRRKITQEIYKTALTPAWLLNIHLYQKALDVQERLMTTAKSEHVRFNAANSILTHLKAPEAIEDQYNEQIKNEGLDILGKLKEATEVLASAQKSALKEKNLSVREIIEGEIV